MAICSVGPYGHPSGKIGNVVFYMLNGQPVCRMNGKPGKPSIKQLGNRQAMAVTMDLVAPMADFINVSFKQEAEGTVKNPHNLAVSYNKKEALIGEYPNIKVDYSKVILSRGDLEMVSDLKISKGEDGINLSWNTDISENGSYDDLLMVLVNHPTKKRASSYLNAAKRADGSCFIPISEEWMMREQMEIYVSLKSSNEKSISDSVYAGNLNGVPESQADKVEKAKYTATKARFDQVSAAYYRQRMDDEENIVERKAFRHLEREFQVLKEKLKHLPGKPS
ncbi:DUF6266 family protein [Pedobacter gandavensis]|uniref:Uncharacterized protein n=1 Tax=Pedobacter gandavensis TaxID=2679963 RepID=A0ABR6ERE6_9SPHI|nr:DUF6266 family protein [Pedobacter gandavensis]MBB2147541.1 hypothetical protein [Pedobacter gandavensis]